LNGLCAPSSIDLKGVTEKYPVPIFFDKKNNAYFNFLNNYLCRKSYWGTHAEEDNRPILQQLTGNFTIPWSGKAPSMRRLLSSEFDSWCNTNRLKPKHKKILIIPDMDGIHDEDCLQWNHHNIRELSALVSSKGFRVVVASQNSGLYYGTKISTMGYDYRMIISAIRKSWMVLSSSVDWLLIAMMMSDCYLASTFTTKRLGLIENAEIIQAKNVIFTDRKWLSPMDVYAICEGS
jgi:hypothetical protein